MGQRGRPKGSKVPDDIKQARRIAKANEPKKPRGFNAPTKYWGKLKPLLKEGEIDFPGYEIPSRDKAAIKRYLEALRNYLEIPQND